MIEEEEDELRDAKVEGTGSGFVWDKAGHIVRTPNSTICSIDTAFDLFS